MDNRIDNITTQTIPMDLAIELGFIQEDVMVLEDDGATCYVMELKINRVTLVLFYTYNTEGKLIECTALLNGEQLEGRPLTESDIKLLKEIL